MKKDLNYIASLEKAIAKKYGDISIQNPSSFWGREKEEDYLCQLESFVEKQHKHEDTSMLENVDGILITRKLLNKEGAYGCPVCKKRLKTINDDIYFTKFECCERCYIEYVESREERWLGGWRPKNVRENT
jgi:hypothetical protein